MFTLAELLPIFEQYGADYGFDYRITAAVAYQESEFRNYRVHNDGTGHGLFGLDDNGLRPDFERWSGIVIGKGRDAGIAPVGKQIEYASYQLKRYQTAYNDPWAATRAWHRGGGLMNDAQGYSYQSRIQAHVRTLFG